MNELQPILPDEVIMSKIYIIRNQKVMLDRDLAELYGVETRGLNQAVKRNENRFPSDFMFQLTESDFENLISQNVTSSWGGHRKLPFAFTEHGVLMLSNVLKSERAIKVSILIIRVFTKMREMLATHKEILQKLDELEKKYINHDEKFMLLFEYLKQFEKAKQEELEQRNRPLIGFKNKQ